MVRKVFLFAYELDLPFDAKIHPVVSIIYFSRYRMYEDLFGCILSFLGLVEYGLNTDIEISDDDEKQGKHWELERIVVYETRRSQTRYLVCWKDYDF